VPTVHREQAFAKLTRTLAVTGVREDGYHLIDSEMATLDLADELEILPVDPPSSLAVVDEVAWTARPGLRPDAPAVPVDASNLVLLALDRAGRAASVRLTKRIPASAGLGGGSADAAAILRWAGVSDPSVAAQLGADVPFCLAGGRARVSGIGEVLEPLPRVPLAVVLVTPGFGVSSALVYKAWDAPGGPTGAGPNDLEIPALEVEPRLLWWRDFLAASSGRRPLLAGSGSSWFFECRDFGEASRLARELQDAVLGAGEPAMVVACTESGAGAGAGTASGEAPL
jgi:4-diphosphocytidyl-2-C-methyl-D-erythritol kinase